MDCVRLRLLFAATGIVLLSLVPWSAEAADATPTTPAADSLQVPPAPHFDITAFKVTGDTILGADKIDALVKPYIGKSKDFGDVQQALDALQDAYQALGFSAVHVNLPEQELESGVIQMTVTEQTVGSIKIEGNKHYTDDDVLRAVPTLQVGSIPNTKGLAKTLKIANENPSKQTAVLFADNEENPDVVDATVKVADDKPWKAFVTLDNTGSRETGHDRLTFGYQNFNMFDTDQRLTAEFITNPHYPANIFNPDHKVDIYAFAYTIPLISLGDSIDLIGSYSDTTSTTPIALSGLFGAISGKGLVLGGRYNHNLDKLPDFEHKISLGYDSRATRSSHDSNGNLIASAITTTPVSVTYSGQWTPNPQVVAFSIAAAHNIPGIADHGNSSDFANIQANNAFNKLNINLDYSRPLPKDWQFHASYSSQFTADSLPSIEKFRVGGVDTVRGFHESELAGDEGFRIGLEALTFDFGKVINDKTNLRGALFFDMGRVSDNENTIGGAPVTPQTTISSIGTGLRYNYNKSVTGRFDIAQVINGDANTGGSARSGDHYVNVSVGYMW